jgi:hypothetical protein
MISAQAITHMRVLSRSLEDQIKLYQRESSWLLDPGYFGCRGTCPDASYSSRCSRYISILDVLRSKYT